MVHGRVSVYRAEGIHTTEFCSKTEQYWDRTVSILTFNCIRSAHTYIPKQIHKYSCIPKHIHTITIKCMQISCCGFWKKKDQISFPHNEIWEMTSKTVAERWFIQGIPCRLWQMIYGVSVMEILPQFTQVSEHRYAKPLQYLLMPHFCVCSVSLFWAWVNSERNAPTL